MFIKARVVPTKSVARRAAGAFTFPEVMVGLGIFTICGAALASLFLFGTRSFAAISNYAVLDKANRQAMDTMTREIRSAIMVTSYTTNPATLTLLNSDTNTVVYTFNPNTLELQRSVQGSVTNQILLTNCTLLQFELYKRNPSNASYTTLFPVATNNWQQEVKVIQLSWKTSMTISPTANVNSENVQTARIVIRKAQVTD